MRVKLNNWDNFTLDAELQLLEQLLIEGRYDDAAKKYPDAVEETIDGMPVLKYFSKHDESGNNKYIMWMARQFADDMARWKRNGLSEEGDPDWRESVEQRADDIATAVRKYHRLLPYVRDDEAEYKDIYKIEDKRKLDRVIYNAHHKKQRKEQEKEQARREKAIAHRDSVILIDDNNFMMVRPETAQASCFWGRETRWCISASQSQNYFDNYTSEGKAFYFVFMKNKKNFETEDWPTYKKIALVYEPDSYGEGGFVEGYDTTDSPMDADEISQQIATNLVGYAAVNAYDEYTRYGSLEGQFKEDEPEHYLELVRAMTEDGWTEDDDPEEWWSEFVQDAWHNIEASASQHSYDNPAGPRPEQFDEIHANAEFEYADVSYDEYEPGKWYWSASMSFDFEELDWVDDGSAEEADLEDEISEILDAHYIHPEEIEVYGDNVNLTINPSDYDESEGLEGFQTFVNNVSNMEENYVEARLDIIDLFIDNGVVDVSSMTPYGKLRGQARDRKWEYFTIDSSGGTIQYRTTMSFKVPEIAEIAQSLTRNLKGGMSATGVPDPDSPRNKMLAYWQESFRGHHLDRGANNSHATNILLDQLSGFFRQAQEVAAKQMNLPGIPAGKVKQLVTPAAVRFYPYSARLDIAKRTVEVNIDITVGRDVSEAQLQAVGEFTAHFDENYDTFHNIARAAVLKVLNLSAQDGKMAYRREFGDPSTPVQEKKIKECGPMPRKRITIRIGKNK